MRIESQSNVPSAPSPLVLSEVKRQNWVSMASKEAAELVKILANNITVKTHEEFLTGLERTGRSIKLGNPEHFCLVVPQSKNSNSWVTQLASPYINGERCEVIMSDEVAKYREKNPDVIDYVYADDACYSATSASADLGKIRSQLSDYVHTPGQSGVQEHFDETRYKIHAVIPFMTKFAEKRLQKIATLGDHETIPSLRDILETQADSQTLIVAAYKYFGDEFQRYAADDSALDRYTLFILAHKGAPDHRSFPVKVREGVLLGRNRILSAIAQPWTRFIPKVDPLYRQ